MSNVRPIDRDMDFLMPPPVDEWLPQRHLARFVAEVTERLDLRAISGSYRGSGDASCPRNCFLARAVQRSVLTTG